MHPKNLSIHDYTYTLPQEKIADHPLSERDASRLLIYQQGNIKEDIYRHIASHLPGESLVVFNDTKVIAARLLFQKPTGGVIEIFCLEPAAQYREKKLLQAKQISHYMLFTKRRYKMAF
ncbi:MAG: hypothetical protein EOO01_45070 [Chitinophagaceae bacterium]|nr:MAG: hypothetical protein EOO01_45070 [Chitinophagaceae bacterium]